ncbi:hypothetical protein Tco_0919578 [Tanacetum coccineum]
MSPRTCYLVPRTDALPPRTDTSYLVLTHLQSDTQSLFGHVSPPEWCHVACYYSAADRSTATGPPVNGGQWRHLTAVNTTGPPVNDDQRWRTTGQPPLDHRWTTVGPPSDHRWTTAGPPVNGGWPPVKAGQQLSREDEGDMDVAWDITFKDVERLRQFLTPAIHTPLGPVHDKEKIITEEEHDCDIPLHDGVIQPLTLQTVHITPPDYVASTTNPILNKQLNEFRKEFSDITRVTKKANGDPVNNVKELSDIKTYDYKTII